MKQNIYSASLISLFIMQSAYAEIPVTMSDPTPAIVSNTSAGSSNTYTYTITNNVPKSFPITVRGISGPVTRVTSPYNDCGNALPVGPSTCNIQFSIAPTSSDSGQTYNQTLAVDYQGRLPLVGKISFTVAADPGFLIPKFAYVTQYDATHGVMVCTLDAGGVLTNCNDAGGHSVLDNKFPQAIAFNNAGTTAFLTGYTDTPFAFQCTINPLDGTFSACSSTNITTPTGYDPQYGKLTLNHANTTAFIADGNGSAGIGRILACPISNNTIGATCADTVATGLGDDPVGIVFNAAETIAYIGDYPISTVSQCSVNGSTFSGCNNKTGDGTIVFSDPAGVALNNNGSILYVADNGTKNVYGCNTTPNGPTLFSHCFIATTVTGASTVWSVTLNAGGTVAYVTDFVNTTYTCPVLAGGTFGTCVANTGFTSPEGVGLLY
jgi:hypothetical protein